MISAVFITFISAMRLTAAANVVALQQSNIAFIILFLYLVFRQKPSKRDVIVVIAAFIGITMFFFDSFDLGRLWGNIIAIISGMACAAMFLYNSRVKAESDHISALVLGHAITFIVGFGFVIARPPELNMTTVSAILALGFVQQAAALVLYAKAIRVCSPLSCSLISMLQLPLNPLLVYLVVGEIPSVFAIIGGTVILLVVVLNSIAEWVIQNKK